MTDPTKPTEFTDQAEFDDIPGTTVFTAQQSRKGFQLNQFCGVPAE